MSKGFTCWCDGDQACHGTADVEYGLCPECERFGHQAMPALPFSIAEAEEQADD